MNPHVMFDQRVGVHMIAGSRVVVANVWHWHSRGVAIATLFKRYPKLRPSEILDALSWAHDDVERVEREVGVLHAGLGE